jgi:hypothetical protein
MNITARFFGRDRTTARRLLMLAVGLFVMLLVLLSIDSIFIWVFTEYKFLYILVALLGLAALNAYLNDGLVISCLLAYIPTVSLLVYNVGFATDPELPYLLVVFVSAATGGLLYGLPPGLLGYLLGAGVRRFTTDSAT